MSLFLSHLSKEDRKGVAFGITYSLYKKFLSSSSVKHEGKKALEGLKTMNEQNQTEGKPSMVQRLKALKIGVLGMVMLFLAGSVFAAVLVHSFTITYNINENIACSNTDITLDGFPSATTTHTVTCANAGTADQDVRLGFSETTNDGVQYAVSTPTDFVVPAGASADQDMTFVVDSASPTGTVVGEATVNRI